MQTTIKQVTPVEYELEIDATAKDLAPKINQRLKAQQAQISLKGFRKGKVPMPILKKMFGESLVMEVIEREVLGVFQSEVIEPDELKVVGMPSFGDFDYKLDGDLHAVLKFGVHPEIEIKDLSGEKIMKLVHEVSDEEVDDQIKQMRLQDAELSERKRGGIKETDHVTIDMQRLDAESKTPIIGEREEDVAFFVDDEKLKDALRAGLLGKKAEATFQVELPVEETPEGEVEATAPYEVTVKEVKQRTLPELDAEFVKKVTREEAEDEAGLKDFVKSQIGKGFEEESRKLLESELMTRMIELHDFPVPNAAVDIFINSFVEDIKRKNNNELPEGFDMASFSAANRDYAEQQARWKMMRDTMVEQQSLEVTDEDRSAYFLEVSGGSEETASAFEQYYKSMQGAMDMINEQLLSKKLFGYLAEQVTLEELNKDEYMEALKAKREAQMEAENEADPVS
ncbi:MAG: trigger factor [Bacteroidota bacterium]